MLSNLAAILDENQSWEEHIKNFNKLLIKTGNSFKIIKKLFILKIKFYYIMPTYTLKSNMIEVYGTATMTSLKKV